MTKRTRAPVTRIQNYLVGVKYPATKNDIVNAAKSNNAPLDVIQSLENLPGGEYRRPHELSAAVQQDTLT